MPRSGARRARDDAARHEETVAALYVAAAELTDCPAEQTLLVTLCVRAGKTAGYLQYRKALLRGRGVSGLGSRPLGMSLSFAAPPAESAPAPEGEYFGDGVFSGAVSLPPVVPVDPGAGE